MTKVNIIFLTHTHHTWRFKAIYVNWIVSFNYANTLKKCATMRMHYRLLSSRNRIQGLLYTRWCKTWRVETILLHRTLLVAFDRHVPRHRALQFPSNSNPSCTVFNFRTWSRTRSLGSIKLVSVSSLLYFSSFSNPFWFFLGSTWELKYSHLSSQLNFSFSAFAHRTKGAGESRTGVKKGRKLFRIRVILNAFLFCHTNF